MAITRISQSSVKEGLEKFTSFYGGASGLLFGDYESIATINGNGSISSLVFSSVPQNYTHLQLRFVIRGTRAFNGEQLYIRINGDGDNNYSFHYVRGNGSSNTISGSSSQNVILLGEFPGSNISSNIMGVCTVDLLDYATPNKNRVVRSFFGCDNNGGALDSNMVSLSSGMRINTAAVETISIVTNGALTATTTATLYGVKA